MQRQSSTETLPRYAEAEAPPSYHQLPRPVPNIASRQPTWLGRHPTLQDAPPNYSTHQGPSFRYPTETSKSDAAKKSPPRLQTASSLDDADAENYPFNLPCSATAKFTIVSQCKTRIDLPAQLKSYNDVILPRQATPTKPLYTTKYSLCIHNDDRILRLHKHTDRTLKLPKNPAVKIYYDHTRPWASRIHLSLPGQNRAPWYPLESTPFRWPIPGSPLANAYPPPLFCAAFDEAPCAMEDEGWRLSWRLYANVSASCPGVTWAESSNASYPLLASFDVTARDGELRIPMRMLLRFNAEERQRVLDEIVGVVVSVVNARKRGVGGEVGEERRKEAYGDRVGERRRWEIDMGGFGGGE